MLVNPASVSFIATKEYRTVITAITKESAININLNADSGLMVNDKQKKKRVINIIDPIEAK